MGRAHTENRTPWVSEKMMRGEGGCRNRENGRGGCWRIDGILRWFRRAREGSVLRIEKYIYIFCVLPHLESTPLGRVEHQEAFEEVLAVCGHVERDAVLPSEHALPQLLRRENRQPGS